MPDVDMNPRLGLAVKAAKAVSMPKDVIDRAIKKSQMGDGADYTEIRYEGYGVNGIAIIVEAMTEDVYKRQGAERAGLAVLSCGGGAGNAGAEFHLLPLAGAAPGGDHGDRDFGRAADRLSLFCCAGDGPLWLAPGGVAWAGADRGLPDLSLIRILFQKTQRPWGHVQGCG